ncbi:MAG: tetratricopeptide repeat protein [Flavobacteriales bacterium]|nr:tetratricopeptide repeat protein [Flavobacteriales bacterium]
MIKYLSIIFLLLAVNISVGQDKYLDSLYNVLDQSKDPIEITRTKYLIGDYDKIFSLGYWDSINLECKNIPELKDVKANTVNILGFLSDYFGDREKAEKYFKEAIQLFDELGDPENKGISIWNLAVHYQDIGEYSLSLELMNECLAIYKDLNDINQMASSYNGLAVTYDYLGNQNQSLEYYEKAYSLYLIDGDTIGIANMLTNMATIYSDQEDSEMAEKTYLLSNELLKLSGNGESPQRYTNDNNLGTLYAKKGKIDEALKLFEQNLAYYTEREDQREIGFALLNIALAHAKKNEPLKAESEFLQAIDQFAAVEMRYEVSKSKKEYAKFLLEIGNPKKGLPIAIESYQLAQELNVTELKYESSGVLADLYKALKDYKLAYEYLETNKDLGQQLVNEKTKKAALSQQFEIEYLTKVTADSIKNAEKDKLNAAQLTAEKAEKEKIQIESNQRKAQNIYLILGLLLALVFGLFVFNRFKVTQKQKAIIEEQKELVETQKNEVEHAHFELKEKNKEILDSITYAKRIQTAILPPDKLVKELLPDSFVLYMPKDIVAGDFYWLEATKDQILFAAADCTGHGVPGAMVSVICNNGLNRSVREYGLTDPGEILDKTREIVIQEFEKSENEVKDGMDIALCKLSGLTLSYAGANNPLWILRKDAADIEEIKANKQPIGKFISPEPYHTHEVNLAKGDTIYIFSDGYADQFGGEKGKKLKASAMRTLLLSIRDKSMDEQKYLIQNYFDQWKGSLEQIDDVCVIGVRV